MDVTGGLDPALDHVTSSAPADPDHREGTSVWLWDDEGRIGLPRMAIESVAATWDTARTVTVNLTLPDGAVHVAWAEVAPLPAIGPEGRPTVHGAGPIRFESTDAFRRGRINFDGLTAATTAADQIEGDAPRGADITGSAAVPVTVDVDARMVAPPWVQGSLGGEGFVPGEERFEQLFEARGTITVDGQAFDLVGGGLRIHRKGGNRTDPGDFFGHCWQSACMPDGRAFGYIHYHPRTDGSAKFVEGWVMDLDGEVLAAEVRDTPWMRRPQPSGENVSLTLATARGEVRIEGETVMSTFQPERPVRDGVTFPALQQGIARYRWDGVEAFGMIERSIPRR